MEETFLQELDYLIRVKTNELETKRIKARRASGHEDEFLKAWTYAKLVSEVEVKEAELDTLQMVRERYLQGQQHNQ